MKKFILNWLFRHLLITVYANSGHKLVYIDAFHLKQINDLEHQGGYDSLRVAIKPDMVMWLTFKWKV